jgi:hypothetical protein
MEIIRKMRKKWRQRSGRAEGKDEGTKDYEEFWFLGCNAVRPGENK